MKTFQVAGCSQIGDGGSAVAEVVPFEVEGCCLAHFDLFGCLSALRTFLWHRGKVLSGLPSCASGRDIFLKDSYDLQPFDILLLSPTGHVKYT